MAYKTSDGKVFDGEHTEYGNELKARYHQKDLDDAASSSSSSSSSGSEREPNRGGICNNKGIEYTEKGDYDQAISWLTKAIEIHIGEVESNRRSSYYNKDDYDRRAADCAGSYVNRAVAYNSKGDYDKAIADCNEVIKLGYHSGKAYNTRGLAYANKGNEEQAIADYKEAADSGHTGALKNLAKRGITYTPKKYKPKMSLGMSIKCIISGIIGSALGGIGISLLIKLPIISGIVRSTPIIGMILIMAGALFFGLVGYYVPLNKSYSKRPIVGTGVVVFILAALIGFISLDGVKNIPSRALSLTGIVKSTAARGAKNTAQSAAQTATVTSDALNFRAEPSGNAALVKTLKKGDVLNVTGNVSNGWLPVEHGGDRGFVSAEYVEIGGGR